MILEPLIPAAPETAHETAVGLSPVFRVSLRRRHDDAAPVERVDLRARTLASARHAARLLHPDAVIVSIARVPAAVP